MSTARRSRARSVTSSHRTTAVEALERRVLLAGQIYVGDASTGSIEAYSTDGTLVNPALISGLSFTSGPYGDVASSGNDIFVLNAFAGTVGEYTTAGATVNASLITGLNNEIPFGLYLDGTQLYVVYGNGGSTSPDGHVDQYTLGATPGTIASRVPNLITGVADADSVFVSGSTIYVSDYALGTIGTYTTAGAVINASLITGLSNPEAMVQSGSDLFVTEQGSGQRIGEYGLDGSTVNANLVSGLNGPYKIAEANGDLFVGVAGGVGEYTTTGAVVNASLINTEDEIFALNGGSAVASTPTATQLGLASQPTSGTATVPLAGVTADVEDASGALQTTDGSTATLSIATGPAGATLSGTTTAVANGGVATFGNISVSLPGTYTLTATDGALTAATTGQFTVVAPTLKAIGQLDPTVGSGGLASHDVGFTATTGVAADGAQSVLVGPVGAAPSESFGLTRYNADGSLDTTFGTGGVAATPFAGTDAVPAAVAVLANGDILVAGTATTYGAEGTVAGSQFAVAEYTSAGVLDTAFGTGGQVLVGTGASLTNDVLRSLAVGPGGVIYLGGRSDVAGTADLAVVSLTAAGAANPAYGRILKILTDVNGGADVINGLAVQANGDLVAAGSAEVGGVTELALARYLPTGVLDPRFGTKGITTTKVGGVYDSASSVVVSPKGQIVIGGLTASGSGSSLSSNFLVQRYTSSGKLDRTFGTGGTTVTSFGQPSAVTQVVLQADGFLVASGRTSATLGGTLNLAVARYNLRGAPDTTFNGTGKVSVNLDTGVTATPAELHIDASVDLGAAFDAFTSSAQSVVALTPGGEVVSAGNSGANTVEAQLVAAGIDLVTKVLSALPASVLGGAKGTATVTLTEGAAVKATGAVTIAVYFAVDAAGTAAVIARSVPAKVNLNQGQSKTYKLPFTYPATATPGGYYLLATATDGAGLAAELNAYNNVVASPAPVAVAPAFVSLTGSALSATGLAPGASATVSLTVANAGNVTAKGKADLAVYLSTDGTLATATSIGDVPVVVGLSTGKSKSYRLRFKVASSAVAGTYTLIGVLDPNRSLGATDQTNVSATIIAASPVTVG